MKNFVKICVIVTACAGLLLLFFESKYQFFDGDHRVNLLSLKAKQQFFRCGNKSGGIRPPITKLNQKNVMKILTQKSVNNIVRCK